MEFHVLAQPVTRLTASGADQERMADGMAENAPQSEYQRDSTERDIERGTPFLDEERLMGDPNAIHDDLSRVATRSEETAQVAGEHEQSLLYEPGYIYDPRSGAHSARYYPGPASGETEAEQR
jgi:hypothetical protein